MLLFSRRICKIEGSTGLTYSCFGEIFADFDSARLGTWHHLLRLDIHHYCSAALLSALPLHTLSSSLVCSPLVCSDRSAAATASAGPTQPKPPHAACRVDADSVATIEPEKREKKNALTPIEGRTQSPQLNQLPLSPKWCQALYSGHCTLYTVCRLITLVTSRLVTLVTNWGSVAADSAVDFASHIRRARV